MSIVVVVKTMNKGILPRDLSKTLYKFVNLASVKSRAAAPRLESSKAEKMKS